MHPEQYDQYAVARQGVCRRTVFSTPHISINTSTWMDGMS